MCECLEEGVDRQNALLPRIKLIQGPLSRLLHLIEVLFLENEISHFFVTRIV